MHLLYPIVKLKVYSGGLLQVGISIWRINDKINSNFSHWLVFRKCLHHLPRKRSLTSQLI